MSIINRAMYKKDHGQPLTRKEAKALMQRKADPNTRPASDNWSHGYKAKNSRLITGFHVDQGYDLVMFHYETDSEKEARLTPKSARK